MAKDKLKTFEWEALNIEFSVMGDFEVRENTEENFIASTKSNDFVILLAPADTEGLDERSLGKELANLAIQQCGFDPNEMEIETFDCDGGFGGYILGVDSEGRLCLLALAKSLDEESDVCVVITEYIPEDRAEDAGKMLGSIRFK